MLRMEQVLRSHLATLASVFADRNISATTIGKRALNDNTFLPRALNGEGFTIKTYDRVVVWCFENWPENVAWPEGVPEPEPQRRSA